MNNQETSEKALTKITIDQFHSYDVDKSDYLDHDEIESMLEDIARESGIESITRLQHNAIMEIVDKDGNGEIHLDELIQNIGKIQNILFQPKIPTVQKLISEAWAKFIDPNNNSILITKNDCQKIFEFLCQKMLLKPLSLDQYNEIMANCRNDNPDGKYSQQDLLENIPKYYCILLLNSVTVKTQPKNLNEYIESRKHGKITDGSSPQLARDCGEQKGGLAKGAFIKNLPNHIRKYEKLKETCHKELMSIKTGHLGSPDKHVKLTSNLQSGSNISDKNLEMKKKKEFDRIKRDSIVQIQAEIDQELMPIFNVINEMNSVGNNDNNKIEEEKSDQLGLDSSRGSNEILKAQENRYDKLASEVMIAQGEQQQLPQKSSIVKKELFGDDDSQMNNLGKPQEFNVKKSLNACFETKKKFAESDQEPPILTRKKSECSVDNDLNEVPEIAVIKKSKNCNDFRIDSSNKNNRGVSINKERHKSPIPEIKESLNERTSSNFLNSQLPKTDSKLQNHHKIDIKKSKAVKTKTCTSFKELTHPKNEHTSESPNKQKFNHNEFEYVNEIKAILKDKDYTALSITFLNEIMSLFVKNGKKLDFFEKFSRQEFKTLIQLGANEHFKLGSQLKKIESFLCRGREFINIELLSIKSPLVDENLNTNHIVFYEKLQGLLKMIEEPAPPNLKKALFTLMDKADQTQTKIDSNFRTPKSKIPMTGAYTQRTPGLTEKSPNFITIQSDIFNSKVPQRPHATTYIDSGAQSTDRVFINESSTNVNNYSPNKNQVMMTDAYNSSPIFRKGCMKDMIDWKISNKAVQPNPSIVNFFG